MDIYKEYLDCKSQYIISDKSSDRISSDGEFNDANLIYDFSEDDSHINQIER